MFDHFYRIIRRLLTPRQTRGLDLDDPKLLHKRQEILRDKNFLRRIYINWYTRLTESIDQHPGRMLEIGSGAGFFNELNPNVLTSDIVRIPGLSTVLDACTLPFKSDSLNAIVMCNVLHHLPRVGSFFEEAGRCIQASGHLVMIEPWVTSWSRIVYTTFHHEPFDPDSPSWTIQGEGHLSGANGALPWIVFARDRGRFEETYPDWRIIRVEPFMPFLYLLSGGISGPSLMPGWMYPLLNVIENALGSWNTRFGMFAIIHLVHR